MLTTFKVDRTFSYFSSKNVCCYIFGFPCFSRRYIRAPFVSFWEYITSVACLEMSLNYISIHRTSVAVSLSKRSWRGKVTVAATSICRLIFTSAFTILPAGFFASNSEWTIHFATQTELPPKTGYRWDVIQVIAFHDMDQDKWEVWNSTQQTGSF